MTIYSFLASFKYTDIMDKQDCLQISGASPSELHEPQQEIDDALILQ